MSTDTLVSTSSTQHTTSTATAKPSPKIIVRDYAYTPVKVYEIIPQTQSRLSPSPSSSSSSTDSSKLLTPTTKEIPVIGLAREGEKVVVCESPECSDDEDGIVWMNNEGSNKGHT